MGLDGLALASGLPAAGALLTGTRGASGAGAGTAETEVAGRGAAVVGCNAVAMDEVRAEAVGAIARLDGDAPATNAPADGATRSPPAPEPLSQEMPRLWQVSQGAVVAGCSLGLVLTPGYVPPWQFAQPVVIPAWFIDHDANVVVLL